MTKEDKIREAFEESAHIYPADKLTPDEKLWSEGYQARDAEIMEKLEGVIKELQPVADGVGLDACAAFRAIETLREILG